MHLLAGKQNVATCIINRLFSPCSARFATKMSSLGRWDVSRNGTAALSFCLLSPAFCLLYTQYTTSAVSYQLLVMYCGGWLSGGERHGGGWWWKLWCCFSICCLMLLFLLHSLPLSGGKLFNPQIQKARIQTEQSKNDLYAYSHFIKNVPILWIWNAELAAVLWLMLCIPVCCVYTTTRVYGRRFFAAV